MRIIKATLAVFETVKNNLFAQSLYEREGYTKDSSDFLTYSLPVPVVDENELMLSPVPYERNSRKLVVITGVTSGLGRAMLDRFNELGWMVAGCGREGDSSVSAYCASKFAIEGLSQSMAKELPEGMAVITLDPRDGVDTPMLHQCASSEYVKTAPSADAWSRTAVPFILGLTPADNGKALTCPEVDMNQEDKKSRHCLRFATNDNSKNQ